VYALYKAGKWSRAYEQVAPPKETFEQLVGLFLTDRKGTDLEQLIAAHRARAGASPSVDYYAARAKLLLKQPDRAVPLLRQAYAKEKEAHQRNGYVIQFVQAMHELGRGLEGYRAAPDKALAFEDLARTLTYQKKADELKRLLAEHGKRDANSAPYRFYCGELALLAGNVAEADGHFTAALGKAPRQADWRYRQGLVRARVKAGKTARTYQEAGAVRFTFEELAQACVADRNARELESLLTAHRRAEPEDEALVVWKLELHWLKKDYEGALKVLAEHRAGALAPPRFRWKRDDYLVRCLVRLKRPADAVREAQALTRNKRGDAFLLLLAHAAAGDVKNALASMSKSGAERYYL
jgi:hypothetical protein